MMEIFNSHPLSFRALTLDAAFPKSLRRFFILVSLLAALGAGFLLIFPIPSLLASGRLLLGVLFAAYGFFLANTLLEFFSVSDLKPWPVIRRDEKVYKLGVEAARIFYHTRLLSQAAVSYKVLLEHIAGGSYCSLLLLRLGISWQDFQNFLAGRGEITPVESAKFFDLLLNTVDKKNIQTIWLSDVLTVLADRDEPFSKFLFQMKVKKEDLAEAAEWVEFLFERERRASVWWDPENLLRIGGLGRDLGFGYTRTLDQYAHELHGDIHPFVREARKDEIRSVEEVLSRSYQANLLLVGEAGSGKHTILEGLAHRIFEGKVVPALESKRMMVFDYQSASAGAKTKGSYEALLIQTLGEAVHAGNIILIIENFSDFLASSSSLGVNAFELLQKFISGSRMQMIALSDPDGFHRDLEPNTEITKLFEKIEVSEPTPERALRMLEDASLPIEALSGKFFTL
ncbi:MAG: ATP-dependent Clp protease ATP-binding subunit, partial [Candidatus Ryanbacteria bacterium]|nr:ATP-dependent Clp protease ATP-binding subunit [Candidatus Ryanbacteria bacterium]